MFETLDIIIKLKNNEWKKKVAYVDLSKITYIIPNILKMESLDNKKENDESPKLDVMEIVFDSGEKMLAFHNEKVFEYIFEFLDEDEDVDDDDSDQ